MSKIITIVLSVFLIACSTVKVEEKQNAPLEMPPIVFMEVAYYEDVSENYKVESAMGFYDNKGNYYTIDKYIYSYYDKNANDIFEIYKKGELDKYITFQQKCDINDLEENHKKLYEIPNKDKIKLIDYEAVPQVQTEFITYYGFYYDRNKQIKSVCLGEYDKLFRETDNEQANEIYKWYKESLKENYLIKMYQKEPGLLIS